MGALISTHGQNYQIGDLYTTPDGSQGVVFYLFSDGTGGWIVALHDASPGCMWGPDTDIPELPNQSPSYYQQLLNDTAGFRNTQFIRNLLGSSSGYAGSLVDFDHGWYLPSASQLSLLFSKLPVISNGLIGSGGALPANDWYWSSSEYSENAAWRVDFGVYNYSGYFNYATKNSSSRVRAVRTFSTVSMSYDSTLTYLWGTGNEQPFITVNPEQTTTYSVTATSAYGCSSDANQTIIVGTGVPQTVVDEVCQGVGYEANGFVLTEEETSTVGTLTRTRTTETNGCEADLTLHLTVLPKDSIDIYRNACNSYTWNGITYYESGKYLQYYNNRNGCDSIVALHLTIFPEYLSTLTRTICSSELPYDWDGTFFYGADIKVDTLSTIFGCDSIVIKILKLYPTHTINIYRNICQNELPYTWNDESFSDSETRLVTKQSENGCDSIVRMALIVNPMPYSQIASNSDTLCEGDSVMLHAIVQDSIPSNSYTYSWNNGESGPSIVSSLLNSCSYVLTVTNSYGCSMISEKDIAVLPRDTVNVYQSSCNQYSLNGIDYEESGTYIQRLTNRIGCDSIVVLNLSVYSTPETIISVSNDSVCVGNTISLQAINDDSSASALSVSIGDILCSDGCVLPLSDWSTSGKTAIGVVFYVDSTGEHGLAVHLFDQGSNIKWSLLTMDIPSLTNYAIGRDASSDFDGFANTQIIRSTGNANSYPAAWLVDFENGWFLPAAGQLNMLYVSLFSVNNSLIAIGGSPFSTTAPFWYWSSTEQSQGNAWHLSSLGSIGINPKSSVFNVRSIRSF